MINFRCRYYRPEKPCIFNKRDGSQCSACTHVSEFGDRILFVKLDAIGDVLRSASLLPIIKARHDRPHVTWITRPESVALVRMITGVDDVIALNEVGLARISTGAWDQVYSLSNDLASAALATSAAADPAAIVGYGLDKGIIKPSNAAAERWLEMAAFDQLKKANTQSYQRRMADILDHSGSVPPPALEIDETLGAQAAARIAELFPGGGSPRVAINVGAGGRWPKKMLDNAQIARLAMTIVQRSGADVMLVGGMAESEKAAQIAALCAAEPKIRTALTTSSIPEFVALLSQADLLVCGDTLAVHIATALGLPTIALFGPTSLTEIADFDGLIARVTVTGLDCLCCYGDCSKEDNCMSLMDVGRLAEMAAGKLAPARA